MEFFIDTGDINEIKTAYAWGFVDGVTTNPTLVAKSGKKNEDLIKEIAEIVDGPISAEVIALDASGMIKEGTELSKIHKNIVIKLPMTKDGMIACKHFSKNGIKTKLTEKELELILALNQNKGLDKSFLIRTVWKRSSDLESHAFETHLHRLRKKINEFFKDKEFIIEKNSLYYLSK